ncbi:hypothetical protein [Deminuibacter soli]|uniref:Lipopolysaccharide biosynthesis protein n=1 Tax=Deminuibacter soli TaxID=2291815 RepID=A0A3E1NFR7_9BACT|nr:hypothetical protein [Deminuibacter soli]RFM26654.1 hypothetical protein DXN05_18975 [Deminuibacter soli]
MQQTTGNDMNFEDREFSLAQTWHQWTNAGMQVLHHWKKLLAAAAVGALLGGIYAAIKPVTYTASMSFVMEDTKTAGGSLMSALSGLGIDMGGLSGGSGMLAGDNIQALVKSPSFVRRTLLTPYNDTGNYSLADKYAEIYQLKEKWLHHKKVQQLVQFPVNSHFTRLQDSLMQRIIKSIVEGSLAINKPDKKLNIFQLDVSMREEKLSQLFCERLLSGTINFYIDTKTHRLKVNVDRLQQRADSISTLLNHKTLSSSQSDIMLLDANPAYAGPVASAEITSREKLLLTTIYAEVVKNLELSKTALAQETPVVQIIDNPDLPLKRNESKWYVTGFAGAALCTLAIALLLLFQTSKRLPDS